MPSIESAEVGAEHLGTDEEDGQAEHEQLSDQEATDKLKNLTEELVERGQASEMAPAEGRNFEWEITPDEEHPEQLHLAMTRSDGTRLDLNQLLPEGFHFRADEKYVCDRADKAVGFPPDRLAGRGAPLAIFHELGHAALTVRDLERSREQLLKIMAHVSSKLSEQGVEPDRLSEELDRVDPDKFMPDWFLEKKYEFLAGSERSAHALGLSALRALEKDGFKVLAGFRNRQEIQALVSHHLTTYEWGRFLELWPHRRQVLKPIFLRHRKYLSSLFGTTPAA